MTDDNIELSRRKVLTGLGTIGVAGAAAGAGTTAYFSDTESSTGNTVSAGTLDLVPGASSDGSSFNIAVSDLVPDDTGTEVGYLDLKNAGTVGGLLDYEITGWTDYENGIVGGEADDDPGAGGELGGVLEIDAWVDRSPGSGGRNDDEHITSGFVDLSTGLVDTDVSVAPGETIRIWVDARIPSGTDNRVQSDSVEVDVDFILDQA